MNLVKPKFRFHEPTGILEVYWAHERNEPCHIMTEGDIGADKKGRKPGIWQQVGIRDICFTCPWCAAIGKTSAAYVNTNSPESIWCSCKHDYSVKKKGCGRHLTLFYRRKGEERDHFRLNY